MNAALNAGGCVVGVLVENLLRNSVARDARKAIADDRLLLISPYHPEARFTVGTEVSDMPLFDSAIRHRREPAMARETPEQTPKKDMILL